MLSPLGLRTCHIPGTSKCSPISYLWVSRVLLGPYYVIGHLIKPNLQLLSLEVLGTGTERFNLLIVCLVFLSWTSSLTGNYLRTHLESPPQHKLKGSQKKLPMNKKKNTPIFQAFWSSVLPTGTKIKFITLYIFIFCLWFCKIFVVRNTNGKSNEGIIICQATRDSEQ